MLRFFSRYFYLIYFSNVQDFYAFQMYLADAFEHSKYVYSVCVFSGK